MANNKFNMKRFGRSAIAVAVSMCFAGAAYAQNADGSIFGHAKAKEAVTVVNVDTGATRTIEADKDGSFTLSKLPPGRYNVTAGGKTREVAVAIGSGTEVKFDDVATVTVTGSRTRSPIDVSSTESNLVFTLAEINVLPVSRDPTALAMLAPGTVKGDQVFGNLASFSGASVAENGYYINGFDVTNMRNFTNYASLPFDAISQEQIKTGGYGAEFGRSLGGIVSLSTKRGTNTWKGGGSVYFDPTWGQARGQTEKNLDPTQSVDVNNPNVHNQSYLQFSPTQANQGSTVYNAYLGGPIIQDKLFIFGLIQGQRRASDNFYSGTSTRVTNESPNGMIKLDWQINDDHRLEFTGISNKDHNITQSYTNPNFVDHYATTHIGTPYETSVDNGGDVEILKYTGYLTDNLTLTAQIGRLYSLYNKFNDPGAYGANCPAIYFNGAWQGGCFNPNVPVLRDPFAGDDFDKRIGKRIDLEYTIGNHLVRAGWDGQDFTSAQAGTSYSGGIYYRYYPMTASRTINGVVGAGTPGNTEYVRVRQAGSSSGIFTAQNNAWYLEDNWKVVKNVLVVAGLRAESFNNKNADGISFIKKDNLMAPRLSAAWDVNGDASLKVFGNFGRYYIPVATNTNIRASHAEYDIMKYYNFNGKDPVTMAALNLSSQIGNTLSSGSRSAPNPGTIADTDLRPMNQDEFILGFQKAIAPNWTFGMKTVYRKINDGMDDFCGLTSIYAWAQKNGYPNWSADSSASCILMNPGRPLNVLLDVNNDGNLKHVTIPAADIGLPKYERKYNSIELTLDRQFDGKWGGGANYVYAQEKGTAEGYVQSDLGQEDAGITQDFDFADLMKGSYGTLPNNRAHQLKVYGTYAFNDQFRIGTNANIHSGRHTSCLGYLPVNSPDYANPGGAGQGGGSNWGASSYYCLDANGTPVLGSRGDGLVTPWTFTLDMNATYTLKLEGGRRLTLQATIFNIFNSQTVQSYNEVDEYSRATSQNLTGNQRNPNYQLPSQWVAPRHVSLIARYEF